MAARPISLILEIGEGALDGVREAVVERAAGAPGRAMITLLLPEPTPPGDFIGLPARLLIGHEFPEHVLAGIITEARLDATELEGAFGATLVLESQLAVLGLSVDHRIFVDMDVKEIITQVLEEHGILADRQVWQLTASYEQRDMCVQYEESALSFVRRLVEEEGIVFVSSYDDDGELIVFFDSSSAQPTAVEDAVSFERSAGLESSEDSFVAVTDDNALTTGKVTLRDYDFAQPSLDVKGEAEAESFAELERYDVCAGTVDPTHLARWAKVRLEAAVGGRRRITLDGRCLPLSPGLLFSLANAPGALDGDYFVVAARHHYDARTGGATLKTSVVAQPKDVPYRLPLETPVPIAWGHDTAFVVAPEGSEPETIHTEEHGRVKVRFRWDRSGRMADDASAWMRVAQLQTAGSQILPRIDWEVVVEHVEGDPDRPLVTGRLYNGAIPPPYKLPEGKTRTSLQSASTPGGGGRNEIRMEDAAGSEEVAISAQKNQAIVVANDSTESVTVNSKHEIGGNLTCTVGGNETIQITSGTKSGAKTEDVVVGGNREVTVDAVMGIGASGAISHEIGGSLMAMIGSPLKGLLDLGAEVAKEAVEAKAKEVAQQLQEKAQGKVDQLLGSVGDMAAKASGVGAAMDAVSNGTGGMGDALGAAGGLPSPGALGPWARGALGVDDALSGLANKAVGKVQEAMGGDGSGGGGEAEANEGGPDGAMPANAAAEGACGPGHAILHALATLDEKYGGAKITLAAGKVTTVATGTRTTNIGAARIELCAGDRVESCGSKTEKELGRVVIASGSIAETASGAMESLIGGAVLEKVGGSVTIEAGGMIKMGAAFWKVDASGSIVFKCGGSKVTIAGAGIQVSSPILEMGAGTIKFSKGMTER